VQILCRTQGNSLVADSQNILPTEGQDLIMDQCKRSLAQHKLLEKNASTSFKTLIGSYPACVPGLEIIYRTSLSLQQALFFRARAQYSHSNNEDGRQSGSWLLVQLKPIWSPAIRYPMIDRERFRSIIERQGNPQMTTY
jgi:hypothetical protein